MALADSGGPTADDIHDVPNVPAAAVISDFNSDPAGVHSVLEVLLLLSFLLLLAFLLL
jgi:hypothetical protein